eukprot:2427245-Alexandrium_andersonii.AAC.1
MCIRDRPTCSARTPSEASCGIGCRGATTQTKATGAPTGLPQGCRACKNTASPEKLQPWR